MAVRMLTKTVPMYQSSHSEENARTNPGNSSGVPIAMTKNVTYIALYAKSNTSRRRGRRMYQSYAINAFATSRTRQSKNVKDDRFYTHLCAPIALMARFGCRFTAIIAVQSYLCYVCSYRTDIGLSSIESYPSGYRCIRIIAVHSYLCYVCSYRTEIGLNNTKSYLQQ